MRKLSSEPVGLAAQAVVIVWMAIIMVLLFAFGDDIARALADTPSVAALATTMFLIFAAMHIVDGVQATSLGALRGMLDNTWPVVVTLASYWLFALPLAYLIAIPLGVGPNGVWIGYGAGLLLAAILLTWRFLSRTRDAA